jgi:peptidyl-dipeptidase A
VLKNTMTMAGPADPKKTTELTTISSRMAAAYGSGKYCPPGAEGQEACLDVEAVTKVLAESRDPKKLREVWEGWHSIGSGDEAGLCALRRAVERRCERSRLR